MCNKKVELMRGIKMKIERGKKTLAAENRWLLLRDGYHTILIFSLNSSNNICAAGCKRIQIPSYEWSIAEYEGDS